MPRKSKSTPRTAKPYYGTGHDPVWAEQQLTNILQTVTDWERRSAVLVNWVTGEQAAYSVANVLALLLDKPLTPPVDNAQHEAKNGEAEA